VNLYKVLLGIDHAARPTGQLMTVKVTSSDPLSAAIEAERIGDKQVREPGIEYTHAMDVRCVRRSHNVIAFPRQPALLPAA